MKKIDVTKTYRCQFKDEDGFFIHIKCAAAPESHGTMRNLIEAGTIEDVMERKMDTVYQLLTLYHRIKYEDGLRCYGRWLAAINDVDREAFSFITCEVYDDSEGGA